MEVLTLTTGGLIPRWDGPARIAVCGPVTLVLATHPEETEDMLRAEALRLAKRGHVQSRKHRRKRLDSGGWKGQD
jgi:hypothetical protein